MIKYGDNYSMIKFKWEKKIPNGKKIKTWNNSEFGYLKNQK